MQTLQSAGQAEQTIQKSRFFAQAEYCADERAVAMVLRRMAHAHATASHLAYAFRIKTAQGIVQRFSDAGEPSGTAGKPVLQLLEGHDLVNVCVGVIRYYGGINLGTGGLVRAYTGTARLAVQAATLVPFVEMCQVQMRVPFKQLPVLERAVTKAGGQIMDKQFDSAVVVLVQLPEQAVAAFQQQFSQQF